MADCNQPDFWDTRYLNAATPWDFGGIPAALGEFLKKPGKNARVLIPGCGTGHEVKAFAAAGYDVLAVDFAPAAIELAKRNVGPELAIRVKEADFFADDMGAPFDIVYERTFLCSITPDRRREYLKRMAAVVRPGGMLIGFFFYKKTKPEDGPPFGFRWGEADELFSRYFLITKDQPVDDSLSLFEGRERWQERRRTSFVGELK